MALFFKYNQTQTKYSELEKWCEKNDANFIDDVKTTFEETKKHVNIIAYCFMPTHFHFLLEETSNEGVIKFTQRFSNSYSKYFNELNKRRGPLWQSRFQFKHCDNNTYFNHLTRYIHLNPVKSLLVTNAGHWKSSSYNEYIKKEPRGICEFEKHIDMSPEKYEAFVRNHKQTNQSDDLIKNYIFL